MTEDRKTSTTVNKGHKPRTMHPNKDLHLDVVLYVASYNSRAGLPPSLFSYPSLRGAI